VINTAIPRALYTLLLAIAAIATLTACSVRPQLLNSERIEQRYGSYGVEVLEQSATVRRTNLYSIVGSTTTCRTYAVVQFENTASPDIAQAHQAILAGASIGATLSDAGFQINKETFYLGALQLTDPHHPIGKLMHLSSPSTLGMHAYRLVLNSGNRAIQYATIIEAHHPDYLGENELLKIYSTAIKLEPRKDEINKLKRLVLGAN